MKTRAQKQRADGAERAAGPGAEGSRQSVRGCRRGRAPEAVHPPVHVGAPVWVGEDGQDEWVVVDA